MALSPKQKTFINAYLETFNATEAARQAHYKGDDATLASVGWENLRKPEISKAIEERLAAHAMSADEVLKRLAEQARGTMGDFVRFDDAGNTVFDLQAAAMLGKMSLVKKLKTKTRTYTTPTINVRPTEFEDEDAEEEGRVEIEDMQVTEVSIEFELYDAQAALVHIGKHHKLFVDKVEHSGNVMTSEVGVYLPDNGRKDRN